MELKPAKVYYWFAEFEDGFVIKQFDKNGNEYHLKDIGDPKVVMGIDAEGKKYFKPNENYFTLLENDHGRTIKIGWMPFDEKLAKKVLKKNKTVDIKVQKDIPLLYKNVPTECFGFVMQVNHIDVTTGPKCTNCGDKLVPKNDVPWCKHCQTIRMPEISKARVGQLVIRIIPREGQHSADAANYEINLKEVVPSGK